MFFQFKIKIKSKFYYYFSFFKIFEISYYFLKRRWGFELNVGINPLEAGLDFTIDWNKDFYGKQALLKKKIKGIHKKIESFTVEFDEEIYFLGSEPIYRNGIQIGNVTSTKFGYSLNKWMFLGLINRKDGIIDKSWIENNNYEIEFYGKKIKANIQFNNHLNEELLN